MASTARGMDKNKLAVVFFFGIMAASLLLSFFMYGGPDPRYDDSTYLALAHILMTLNPTIVLNRFAFGYLGVFPII